MGNASKPDSDDYAASDDYYARRSRRNARDMGRAIDLTLHALAWLGVTGAWRRLTNWVAGVA